MAMSVAFRVDAGREMGIGHYMRCLNLAFGLRQRGCKVSFMSRTLPASLQELAETAGIDVRRLEHPGEGQQRSGNNAHSHWLPWSQETDASVTAALLDHGRVDWLVVDHYALDKTWEQELKAHTGKIFVIDDLADREHDCDVLLDQNFYPHMSSRYQAHVGPETRLLLGPEFALLHESFARLRATLPSRTGCAEKLLVFFGGSDAGNCTGKVLEALAGCSEAVMKVTVVIGSEHPALEEIRSWCQHHEYPLAVQSRDIAKLMAEADISVGAGGVATWERCCLGLPAIVIAIAANQEPIAEAVAGLGAIVYLGRQSNVDPSQIHCVLSELASNPAALASMSKHASALVDGRGVERACEVMCA